MELVLRNSKGYPLTHAELDGNFQHLDTIKISANELKNRYGADPTGISDSTSAIQAAIDAGSRIDFGDANCRYLVTSTLNLSAGHKWLTGHGATIDMTGISSGNKYGLEAAGALSASGVLLGADANIGDYTVSCANTAGINPGDFVMLRSNAYYPYSGGYNVNRGEFKRVRSVVAGVSITFTTPVIDAYLTVDGAQVHTASLVNDIRLSGLNIQGSAVAGRGESGISLRFVRGFSIDNCSLDGQDIYQIEIASCLDGTVERNMLRSAFYNGVTGTIFYGIAVMDGSARINVAHNIGDRARHLVVTTARTRGQGHYGQPHFVHIHHNHFYDSMAGGAGRSFAYEIHGFGRYITIDHNSAQGCFAGVRVENGSDCSVHDNIIRDYGYAGIIVGGNSGAISNLDIHDNKIDRYTGEVTAGTPAGLLVESMAVQVANLHIYDNKLTNVRNGSFGQGAWIGANSYTSSNLNGQKIDAGVADANAYAITVSAGANGFEVSRNRSYRFRNGIGLFGDDCTAKANLIEHTAAQSTGFGVYSSGTRNIVQGNKCRFINTAWRADTASSANLFIDNQAVQCTVGTFSNAGTGNTARNNDII